MKTVVLGDLAASIDYGVTASAAREPVGPKFLRITDIQGDRVDWEDVPWCECSEREAAASALTAGDIVFARTGATTGKNFLIRSCPNPSVFASYLIRVRLDDRADPGYIAHFFRSADYWRQISSVARGAAQPGVNATVLRSLAVPLPPIEEQRRIAAILDKSDELRAKRRASLAHLDSLTQSIFLDMFGDRACSVRLGELVAVPLRNGTSPATTGGVASRVLTLSAITGGFFDESAQKEATFASDPTTDRSVSREDFLICRGNGNRSLVGRGRFPLRDLPNVAFPDTMIAARVPADVMTRRFMEVAWSQPAVRAQLDAAARTTNGTFKVNQASLERILLPCPPLTEQARFEVAICSIDEWRGQADLSGCRADELFASLQQRAFSGAL